MKLKMILTILAVLLLQLLPFRAEAVKYACGDNVTTGKKAEFVIIKEDEINFRNAPEDGEILCSLDQHTLLRVIKEKDRWLLVEGTAGVGYVFAGKTCPIQKDEMVVEDFALSFSDLNAPYDEESMEGFLGQPVESSTVKNKQYVDYEKLQLVIDKKGYLTDIISRDPQLVTMRGIAVGDAEHKVVGQYGAPALVEYSAESTVYTYTYRLTPKYLFGMLFEFDKKGKVQSMTWTVLEKPKNEKKVKLKQEKTAKTEKEAEPAEEQ